MEDEELIAGGWLRLPGVRYTAAVGPSWSRLHEGRLEVGLQAQEHLGNDNLGIVHGGAIMTFADIALGCGVGHANHHRGNFVTAQMQVQFVGTAHVGDFILCRPEVIRKTSSLVFVRGLFEAADRVVASADGIFKLIDPSRTARVKAD